MRKTVVRKVANRSKVSYVDDKECEVRLLVLKKMSPRVQIQFVAGGAQKKDNIFQNFHTIVDVGYFV